MFQGHNFVKLVNDNWVLDLTEFTGYKVKLNEEHKVESYKEAFSATYTENGVEFDKYINIPLKILKEAAKLIATYIEDIEG